MPSATRLPYLLALVLFPVFLHAEEITFLTDLDQARRAARESGLPIFLDAYTTWCVPCKKMEAEVFTDPEVASTFNTEFVPLRLDMEQEPGRALAEKLLVDQFPTLLILDDSGEELHRSVGFLDVEGVLAFAKTGGDEATRWHTLDARFRRGDRDTTFLEELLAYAKQADIPQRENYAFALLNARDDWGSADAQALLFENVRTADGPLFGALVRNRAALAERYSAPIVDERIEVLLDAQLFGEDPVRPRAARKLIARTYPAAADSTFGRYQMRRAREAGKAKRFGRLAVRQQTEFPSSDPDQLAELAYIFDFKLPGYKTELALSWAEKVLAERPYDEETKAIAERLRERL